MRATRMACKWGFNAPSFCGRWGWQEECKALSPAMSPATIVRIHDAFQGVEMATVDCPKQRVRVPMLTCEKCESCVHASRPVDPEAWVIVCTAVAGAA